MNRRYNFRVNDIAPAPTDVRRRVRPALAIGLGLAIILGWCAWLSLQNRHVTGWIRTPGETMKLKAGVAVWQADSGWLTLFLKPHRLTVADAGLLVTQGPSALPETRRDRGLLEFTVIFKMDHGTPREIDTVSMQVTAPASADRTSVFMQSRGEAPWIQSLHFTNSSGRRTLSIESTGTCSSKEGRFTWHFLTSQLAVETLE